MQKKIDKPLIVMLVCILVAQLTAQVPIRQEHHYGTDFGENCWDHIITDDGGYAFIGESADPQNGDTEMMIIKVDDRYNEQWTATFGGDGDDWGTTLLQTEDEGFLLLGYTRSFGAGGHDIWMIKTDDQGQQEWRRTYGGDFHEAAFSIIDEEEGGYSLFGFTWTFGAGEKDFYLIRTDDEGQTLWTRTFGEEDFEYGRSHVRAHDGGYVMTGYTVSIGHGEKDIGLCKCDEDGELEWWQAYGGEDNDDAFKMIATEDGGYMMCGYAMSFGNGDMDAYLVKVDAEGEMLWSRTYGGDRTDWWNDLIEIEDGGYFLAGYTASYGNGLTDFWIMRTDEFGRELWSQTYGTENDDQCQSALLMGEGYSLAGFTVLPEVIDSQFWLVETSADPVVRFDIRLHEGWNMISTPVPPFDAAMESVWSAIVRRGNLGLVKDFAGQFYSPANDFNNIENGWDFHQGYLVRMEAEDALSFLNIPVAEDTPIELPAGWSMVSYFPEEEIEAPQALRSIEGNLILCKDGLGRFYIPEWNFSNLGNLQQGRGYQINVDAESELIWNR